MTVNQLKIGERAKVSDIIHDADGHWKKLAAFGIIKGIDLELRQKWPAFVIKIGATEIGIDSEIANLIEIEKS
jgi:Fe2+ transport system protein FeoA